MTTFAADVTSAGVAIALSENEDLIVPSQTTVISTADDAVEALNGGHSVTVLGALLADQNGVDIADLQDGDGDVQLAVTSGGVIVAGATGVHIATNDVSISNAGEIRGSGGIVGAGDRLVVTNQGAISSNIGVEPILTPFDNSFLLIPVDDSIPSQSQSEFVLNTSIGGVINLIGDDIVVVNEGRLELNGGAGAGPAISLRSTDNETGARFHNFGVASAGAASVAFVSYDAADTIVNRGVIIGDVQLGGGGDLFDGGGGFVDGGLDLGAGADRAFLGDAGITGDVSGGDGDDVIVGGDADDRLSGGAGDDDLRGGDGDDVFLSAEGEDEYDGGNGSDTVDFTGFVGDVAADIVDRVVDTSPGDRAFLSNIENATGGAGDDELLGDSGVNILIGGAGADLLAGRDGDDLLKGAAGHDQLLGGDGDDDMRGGDGDDRFRGGNGDDRFKGGDGDDRGRLDDGADVAFGGAGNDLIFGGDRGDKLRGDAGDDKLRGDAGGDVLDGGAGADSVRGGDGDDVLLGGADADTVEGENGDDVINGGLGDDRLRGGADSDLFQFGDDFGADRILDFEDGVDLLDFSQNAGVAGFEDLIVTAIDNGASTLITLAADPDSPNSVRLDGIAAGAIDADDFLF